MAGANQRIPLIQRPYPALDSIISPENAAEIIDGWLDEKGALSRRPGLFPWAKILSGEDDAAIPMQGFYYWDAKGIIVVVVGGRIFAINNGDPTSWTELNDVMTKLHPTNSASFASSSGWLIIANGRKDQGTWEWNGDMAVKGNFNQSSPRNIIKLAYIDGYFLAIPDNSQNWYYTDSPTAQVPARVWNPVPLTADGNPDIIRSIGVGWREILLVGTISTEIYYNAGNALPLPPFSRMEGAFIEQGISAANSLVLLDNTWFWLNHQREVIKLSGRNPTVISLPIKTQLKGYQTVSDAIGFQYDRFYCLTFPSANITWIYDPLIDIWYQWGQWQPDQAKWDRWMVNGVTFIPKWGIHFAICYKDSRIFFLHPSLCTDDGEVIAMQYTSGLIDRGTFRRKVCNELVLKLKRGEDEKKMFGLVPEDVRQFLLADLPDGIRCEYYSYTFPSLGDDVTISVSGLPAGLSYFSDSLSIQGTPTGSGVTVVTITLTLASGLVIPILVNLEITDVLPTILFPGEY